MNNDPIPSNQKPPNPKYTYDPSKIKTVSIFTLIFTLSSKVDILILFFGIIGALGSGICANLKEGMSGKFFSKLQSDFIMSGVREMSILYLIMGFAQFISAFLTMGLFTYFSKRVGKKYKTEYFNILLSMDQTWFDLNGKTPFELSSQVVSQLETIQSSIGMVLGNIISELSSLLLGVIFSLLINWKLALILMTVYPFWCLIQVYIVYAVGKSSKEKENVNIKLGGYIEEIIYKIKTVASFANFDYEKKHFHSELENVLLVSKRLIIRTSLSLGFIICLIFFTYSICFIFGGILISKDIKDKVNNPLKSGDLYQIVSMIVFAGIQIAEMVPNIRRIIVSCESAKHFFALRRFYLSKKQIQIQRGIHEDQKLKPEDIKGKITFDNVSFSYPKNPERKVLKDFSLVIEEGKINAFIGESGCGKSTIVNLIEQIYFPTNGNIIIDDKYNINDININYYREQIGYVAQEPVLFNDTIRNNILFGREVESEEEIENAIKQANIEKFIKKLHDGLDHVVGVKGGKLSGGQKQRIAIARALLKKPKILILDEATSALDSKSERQIEKSINGLKGKITIILITHRLNTIKDADNIFVLPKGGNVIIKRSYEELINSKDVNYNVSNFNQRKEKEDINVSFSSRESELTYISDKDNNKEHKKNITENMSLMAKDNNNIQHEHNIQRQNERESPSKQFFIIISRFKMYFIFGLIFTFLSGSASPVTGIVMGGAVGLLYSDDPDRLEKDGRNWGLYMLIICFLAGIIDFFRYYIFDLLGEKVGMHYKQMIFSVYLKLHIGFFDFTENSPGNLVSQMTIKTSAINGVVLTLLSMMVQAVTTILVSNIIGFIFEWRVTLVNLAFYPVLILINYFLVNLTTEEEHNKLNETYGAVLSEDLCNIMTIISFNAQGSCKEQFKRAVYKGSEKDFYLSALNGIFYGMNLCLIFFDYSASFYTVGSEYSKGKIIMSNFLKAYCSVMSGTHYAGCAIKYLKDMTLMKEAIMSLNEQISIKSEIDPLKEESNKKDKINLKGKIEFINVSFAYPSNKTQNVIKNISFTIQPGEKIGFIGTSGSGKSTIIQLIERFYDATDGEILIDGINIKEYNLKSLREEIAFVQQEPVLFSGSIKENIRYGNLDAGEEEIRKIAEKCKIEHKLDSDINVSGGEKQRVAIARAIIREPKILLLDEATSALDNQTEEEIQKVLDDIIQEGNMTVVVVAHRMKAVEKCDKCFVIKNGVIEDYGKMKEINM